MAYVVYMHKVPNSKVYIGITGQKPRARWNSGWGYASNKPFFADIVYYGWRNIEHIILEEGLTRDEACEIEKELIAKYDATNPKVGYNKCKAASGDNSGIIFTKEMRRKLSIAHKGRNIGKFVEGKSARARRIDQYTTNGVYVKTWESTTQIRNQLGIPYTSIVKCCTGVYHSAGDYLWCYEGDDVSEKVTYYNTPVRLSETHKANIAKGVKEHFSSCGYIRRKAIL